MDRSSQYRQHGTWLIASPLMVISKVKHRACENGDDDCSDDSRLGGSDDDGIPDCDCDWGCQLSCHWID